MSERRTVVVIATPLEADLVARIARVDDRLEVHFEPDLLQPLRLGCDHRGTEPFRRTPDQDRRWRQLLADAEVLLGIPDGSVAGLAEAVRTDSRLRWVQSTAEAGNEQVRTAGFTDRELSRVTITSATDVRAGPLAEFAILGMLAFTKGLHAGNQEPCRAHHPMAELAGSTVLVVGLGSVGLEVARLAKAFSMRVVAVNRDGHTGSPHVDEIRTARFLGDLLPVAHSVVLTLPLTERTRGLIDAAAIRRMHSGAVLVNVGHGGVLDEAALVQALAQGRLAGAALDAFATEPLPTGSPLRDLPNVILSPHTVGFTERENERMVEGFIENLRRYLAGTELLNRLDPTDSYGGGQR